jgi:hypothetical protein
VNTISRQIFRASVGGAAALTLAGVSAPQAFAQEIVAPHSTVEEAHSTAAFLGADFLRKAYGVNAGFVHALNRNIGTSGWLFAVTGAYNDERNTKVTPSYSSHATEAKLLVGHQWIMPTSYFAVFAGAHFLNIDETPAGVNDGSKIGAIVQAEFDTSKENSPYLGLGASYSTAHGAFWGRVRAGYQLSDIKFGPEFVVSDERRSDPAYRYGFFVNGIKIGRAYAGISAGVNQEPGSTSNDGFYAAFDISIEF